MSNSRIRYQMLPTDDRTPALEVNLNQQQQQQEQSEAASTVIAAAVVAPPPFINVDLNDTQQPAPTVFKGNNGATFIYIPTNGAASNELPTYEEVLYQKQSEANGTSAPSAHFIALPPMINLSEVNDLTSPLSADSSNEVGTDCIFLTSFLVSFFFNWIGFITCICLMPTIAGKYGALSGFGLSMVKWATIVRYQAWMVNLNDIHQRLFFWIFILAGFYLFFRGLITYVKIKYNPNAYLRRRGEAEWWLFR